jgi:hypothetical protein
MAANARRWPLAAKAALINLCFSLESTRPFVDGFARTGKGD